jgi:hypothetical protein
MKSNSPNQRLLVYIPIIHTQADLGSLGESVRQTILRKHGRLAAQRQAELIDKLWDEIARVIWGLGLDFSRVRLYQDGLPVCGRELEIVQDLAGRGSHNHRLLLEMVDRGAALMGTESPELLVEEYELAKQTVSEGPGGAGRRRRTESAILLESRDRFIASRINETLSDGETGVLFLGMLHAPQPYLDPDIRVTYPFRRP